MYVTHICRLDLILDYTISAHMTLMVSVGTKTIAVCLEFYFFYNTTKIILHYTWMYGYIRHKCKNMYILDVQLYI